MDASTFPTSRSIVPLDSNTNTTWIADTALTPNGWANNVALEVSTRGRFVHVGADGSRSTVPPADAKRVKGVVLPALTNLHSHAFQRGLVGRTEHAGVGRTDHAAPDDFWSWRHAMYAFLGHLDPDAFEDVAVLVYSEMLRAGYGSVVEFHYVHHSKDGTPYDDPLELSRRLLRAAQSTGIRLTLVPVVYEAGGFGGVPLGSAQARFALSASGVVGAIETLVGDPTLGGSDKASPAFGVGLHSLRAASPGAVADVVEWATSHPDVPVHLHIAEQPAEVEACIQWSGARPVEWLFDHAPVDSRWCLVHATHMDETERTRLANSGAVAVLCPTTEANLGDGVFALAEYEAAGGSWGIGSDSQVSVCPADELRMLEYGQRLTRRTRVVAGRSSPAGHSNGRAMVEACYGVAAQASGHAVGRLESGACADIVVLNPEHPRLLGLEQDAILDAWIFGSGSEAVADVMVNGRWVVRDGSPIRWEDAVEGYRRVVRHLRTP